MEKRKTYKLKKNVKRGMVKLAITLAIGILDVIIYHNLLLYGSSVGETSFSNAFILVGWFWLLAGQFIALYAMWEK